MAEADCGSQCAAEDDGEFLEFDAEAGVGFEDERGVALEEMPDLNEEFAGDACDGDIAVAFAGEKLPSPLAEGGVAGAAQDGVGALDEKVADVAAAAASDSEADVFLFAALALAGVEADVGDEFFGAVEASDVANDGHQCKGADDADAEDFHAAHHGGVGAHFDGDEAVEAFAAFFGFGDVVEVLGEEAFLQRGPVSLLEDPLGSGFFLEAAFAEADGAAVEVGFEGVGGGGVVANGFAVGVEEFAACAAFLVGDPDAGGIAGEVDQGDTGGGHFVVVGIGFGVLADMAALKDAGSETEAAEAFAEFEAVAAGFHQDDVLRGQIGGGPFEQGFKGEVFLAADLAGVVWGLAHEERGGEGVGVAVQADDFSFGGRRGSQVGLRLARHRGSGFGFEGGCFCHGIPSMERLGVRQPARAADLV